MTKKLIAIDLDGTLLHHDNTISTYSVEVLKAVRQLGHTVIIATGRPYRMAIDHYRRLELTSPFITFNGALTTLPDKGSEGEHGVAIDPAHLTDLLQHREKFELDFIASEHRNQVYLSNLDKVDPKLLGLDKLSEDLLLDPHNLTDAPYGILLQTRAQDKEEVAQRMRQHFNQTIEINTWGGPLGILELSSKGINKGYALKRLLNHFNISQEDLIAFGDEKNDISMLELAGRGFAMKNANPKLVTVADTHLDLTNEQDGVAKTLEKLFL